MLVIYTYYSVIAVNYSVKLLRKVCPYKNEEPLRVDLQYLDSQSVCTMNIFYFNLTV